jgi:hypothetical protein
MKVLCGKVACLHKDIPLVTLSGETNQPYIHLVMGMQRLYNRILCRQVGHTRQHCILHLHSIDPATEVEQRRLSACPGYGT